MRIAPDKCLIKGPVGVDPADPAVPDGMKVRDRLDGLIISPHTDVFVTFSEHRLPLEGEWRLIDQPPFLDAQGLAPYLQRAQRGPCKSVLHTVELNVSGPRDVGTRCRFVAETQIEMSIQRPTQWLVRAHGRDHHQRQHDEHAEDDGKLLFHDLLLVQ